MGDRGVFVPTRGLRESDMLRVGVLGLGVGRRHIDAYLAHQSSEVTWVCDFDRQLLDDVARNICNVKKTTDALGANVSELCFTTKSIASLQTWIS